MTVGLVTTIVYMVGSRFYGMQWFNTPTVASGVFGIPLGFIVIYVVSRITPPPPQELQDFVTSIRYPKTGGASAGIDEGH